MKKAFKSSHIAFLSGILFFTATLFSCSDNVGLGNQVDTEAPKISISSPAAGDVLSGTFTLSGTCSDDMAVASIPVTIRNTSSSETLSVGEAVISEDGKTWSIQVNQFDESIESYVNGWQFADGTWEVSTIAYDHSKHSSDTVSRSFDIDNTAPVFAIASPNSLSITDPATYGRAVSVSGEIADDHSISSMKIRLFRYENGDATEITDNLARSSFSGFDTAGGTTVKIAQFYPEATASSLSASSDEYALYKNYLAMYDGTSDGDDAYLYAVITLTDVAGNTSDRTYIKSKLNSLVRAATGISSNPETADYKKILNGTYSGSITAEQRSVIKEILTSDSFDQSTLGTDIRYFADASSSRRLAMSVNSDNSPKYEIVGYALGTDLVFNETGSGSTINIKVSAGLDGTYVLPNSLSLSLYQCDDTGSKVSSEPDYTSADGSVTIKNSDGRPVDEIETSVSTATYIITLPTLKAGRYYVVEAAGKDENENELSADEVYAFRVSSSGNAPEVEIEDKFYVKASEFDSGSSSSYDLPVTIVDPEGDVDTPVSSADYNDHGVHYTVTIYGSHISSKSYLKSHESEILAQVSDTITGSESIVPSQTDTKTYTAKIPLSFDLSTYSADNYTIAVSVSAQNTVESSPSNTYIIWADNKAPVLSFTNSDYFDDFGNLKAAVLVTENNAYITQASDGSYSYRIGGKWSDTDGSGTKTLWWSTDSTDRQSGTWTAFSSDDAPQSTDSVKWSDDFDVAESSPCAFSFYAEDETGNVSDVLTVSGLTFDFAVPVIALDSVATPAKSAVTISGTVSDSFAIAEGGVTVTISGPSGATVPDVTKTAGTSDAGPVVSFSATVAQSVANNGSWNVTVSAQDSAGRSATSQSVSFVLDTVAPAFVSDNTSYPERVGDAAYSAENWYKSSSLTLSGCLTEATSGVSAVYYQVVPPEGSSSPVDVSLDADNYTSEVASASGKSVAKPLGSFTASDRDGGIYSYSTTISGFEASTSANTLSLIAVDNAGNVSSIKSYSIKVDEESPTLSCTSHSGQQYTNKVSALSGISGTFTDNASGVKSVVLKIGETQVAEASVSPASEDDCTSGTWTAEIPVDAISGLSSGQDYSVNAMVTDKAGNASASTIFTLSVDTESPSVTLSSPVQDSTINGTISIQGAVSYKGATPKSLALYYTTTAPGSGTTLENLTQFGDPITEASQMYSWSFTEFDSFTSAGVTGAVTSGNLYLIPVVTDAAGNCSVYTQDSSGTKTWSYTKDANYFVLTVDRDSDRPTVKVTNLSKNSDGSYTLKYGENAKIEGTVSDDDATSSSVVTIFVATTAQITGVSDVSQTTDSTTGIVTSTVLAGTNPATYDTTTFNPATGEWTFTPADTGDGEKTVYFYVLDNAGSEFYTGKTVTSASTTYTYLQPYFQYKTSAAADSDMALKYWSDSTAPSVTTLVQPYKSDGSTTNGDAVTPGATVTVGGTEKQYVKFIITGSDANGISGIKLTVSYTSKSAAAAQTVTVASVAGYTDYTQSGSAEDSATTSVWTTAPIDLSDFETGTVSCLIEVEDKSGIIGTNSPIFAVDNSGPGVTVTSPSSTDELTGDITFAGTSADAGNAGTASTAWLIPTTAQAALSDAALVSETDSSGSSIWNGTLDANKTASIWGFTLTSETLAAYDSVDYAGDNISNDVYTLPFYVLTTDNLGNYTIDRTKTIKHNPNADRPSTTISYPNDRNYGTDAEGNAVQYVTLGGAIRISGSAIIPSNTTTVDSVYVQVVNGTDNLGEDEDISAKYTLSSAYAASHGCDVLTKTQVQTEVGKTLTFADDFDWGIKAEKTASWNLTINENDEMNPASGELTYIAIRACAVNAEGKVGTWSPWYYINIDDTAPSQTANLYQFKTQPSQGCTASDIISASNISATRAYTDDMYLKGDWYLTVELHDETELKSFSVKQDGSTLTEGTDYFASTQVTGSDGKEKTQYLFIKVDSTNSSVSYTVAVSDTEHRITQTYSLNIDNTAPVIDAVYKGSVDTESNYFSETAGNSVQDSNYIYTMGGKVSESGSGFERLVFYYARASLIDEKTYATEAVLDPFVTTGTSDAKALLSELTERPFTQGDETYYLYAKEVAGSLGSDGDSFVPDDSSSVLANAHIRKGGLIEVAGLLRLIESIDDSTGTVTFTPSTGITDAPSLSIYFPYAQVVDNTATESVSSQSANPFTFKNSSDDGDEMPETLTGSKSIGFTWDATIHSYNIPDGPCTLVVLAFDKAGNVSGKTYPVKVENSAPRLAKVFFGTDLDSSGTWKADSFEGYNVYASNSDYGIGTTEVKAAQEISTANYGKVFTIKDKLAVVAEIVGGNGDITMVYGRGATTTDAVPASGTESGVSGTANSDIASLVSTGAIGTVTYQNVSTATSLKGFTLASYQVVGASGDSNLSEDDDGTGKTASFTFWDSTDELTAGVNSQNCVVLVNDFTIDLVDSIPPTVVVNPFYWASAANNSLYGSSSANGHIELEKDISSAIAAGTATYGGYGTDPKVSGKIMFTGTAYDEHSLKTLSFSLADKDGNLLDGFRSGSGTEDDPYKPVQIAAYDPTSTDATYVENGGWSALSGNSGAALSDGGKYEWTISTAQTDTGRYYEDTAYLSQQGHKIFWTVSIDSSLIPNVAQENIVFTVTASDGKNDSAGSTPSAPDTTDGSYIVTDGTTHVPSYQMDVVPYITKVYTTLAKQKKTNWSVYNRTALGHYPVQSVVSNMDSSLLNTTTSEDIILYGFNLNSSAAQIESGDAIFTVGNATDALAITSSASDGTLTFNAASLATGKPVISVNGITAMNNINANDAKGDASETGTAYANWYNRQANGDTNNILTDDIEFDVWEFNDRAAVPINGLATGICMDINPVTGMLNYAFANGGLYYSMGGNTGKTTAYSADNSYSSIYWAADWDTFAGPCVGFHVDELGYTYSVDSGGDTNGSGSVDKWNLWTSRWDRGTRDTGGTLGGTNALRLEEIALKTGGGTFDYSLMKYRYLSAEFASTVSGSNTNLYLVYYDALTNQIRFRAGTFTGTSKQQPSGFTDSYTDGAPVYYSTANCQVIANDPLGGTFKSDATTDITVEAIEGRGAGQYVDVAVVKDENSKDVVCVVWYDQEENCCKFSCITDPITNWTSLKGDATAKNWSEPQTIFGEGGEYCHIVADKNNHLHIAAYAGNGDVMYAYLDSPSSDVSTCAVDASGAVGEHLTLDVAVSSNGNAIPYIGYYTAAIKKPKYAYLVDKATGFNQTAAGVDDDERFTGAWEVAVVPTPSRMTTNREDKVNVGVWKNAGVLTASTEGTSSRGGSLNGYSSTNWSKTFGNSTANGILGYQISTSTGSCLETAQMR